MQTRKCSKCDEDKSLENDFYATKTGYEKVCKNCRNIERYNRRLKKRIADGLPIRMFTTRQTREMYAKGLKYCPRCKVIKEVKEFNKLHQKHSCHCKQCMREMYDEKYNSKQKANRYQLNKRQYRNTKLKKKFGITIEEYDKKLVSQDHKCAICKLSVEDNGKSLAVDHNHETGKIRDLLCNNCNVIIGFMKERAELCDKIKKYISKHKE